MNFNRQIKYLWGIPSYRVRLLLFVVLGGAAILASLLVKDNYWQGILSNFAVTFAAVGFIDFMWDILGGEPMEAKMISSFAEVNTKLSEINQSMSVVADLVNNQIGLERIWPMRSNWEKDPDDGREIWIKRICQAEKVDIVSNTFDAWSKNEDFTNELLKAINKGTKVKLLIYDPESQILDLRFKHEQESRIVDVNTMKLEVKRTLERFAAIRKRLDITAKDNLTIRLTQGYYHLAQIIRADNRMLITIYLSGKTGSPSPTFQILGPESTFFKVYEDQFETLWNGYIDKLRGAEKPMIKELIEEDYQHYYA